MLEIIKSTRFQQLVVGLVLVILGYYQVIPAELANIIAGFFGVSISIRTIDRFAEKAGSVDTK